MELLARISPAFLLRCTVIKGISVYELLNEYLTELSAILHSFSSIPQVLT